jgi:hypothetical protein
MLLLMRNHTECDKPGRRRKRIVIQDGEAPNGALVWSDWQERNRLLVDYRRAVIKKFPESRDLRLAWVLRDLMVKEGYAFASDDTLRAETGMGRKLRMSLEDLQTGGAIVRAHVLIDGEWQRRIYPGKAVLEVLENAAKPATKRANSAGGHWPPGGANPMAPRGPIYLRTTGQTHSGRRDSTPNVEKSDSAQKSGSRDPPQRRDKPNRRWVGEEGRQGR